MKRIVGSGSEPRYLPVVSNTSCWGLVLYLFCASAPEAVPAIRTRAMAVLVNMVVSCSWVCSHLAGVRLHLLRFDELSESARCIATFGAEASRWSEKARQTRVSGACAPAGGDALVAGLMYLRATARYFADSNSSAACCTIGLGVA